ncbi:MAG: hypothetical protein GW917_00475 [Bdellovibrionales bacterium]|nr:hypothetical protein [Bdellovibrionales bacterium]
MTLFYIFLISLIKVSTPSFAEGSLEVQIGERLFMEDRFSEWFFRHSKGQMNRSLASGDPTLDLIKTDLGIFDHPLKGRQMSCASCHFVDQLGSVSKIQALTYNDFYPHSPIPSREDGKVKTLRNTSNMVGMSLKEGVPLHWDGEFFSGKDLACASLVGRNMGWNLTEAPLARRHIVSVLRQDDGSFPTLDENPSSYSLLFKQVGVSIEKLSDHQLFEKSCEFIGIYMQSLDFERDEGGYTGSAYDQFLSLNGIRRGPKKEESTEGYVEYLRDVLQKKTDWKWSVCEVSHAAGVHRF